jgi:glyoxylase-like metal-dependent hydrolase (beta-lactamase superfamily II)
MKIEQIYTGCLAEAAYYIESNGEAAIIDPLREVEPYIKKAKENNAKIKYVFETHFHADFVSGHVDLAKKTDAVIVYGPTSMETGFKSLIAHDGEVFKLGNITIQLIHTPGHTMESTTYLLIDENGKDHCIFSGDTLFIGDVGRPDLVQKAASMTQEQLAGTLFHSLRNKIMTLADDVIVYPAHGAGSACGKALGAVPSTTVGYEKMFNPSVLAAKTEQGFVDFILDAQPEPPLYFARMKRDNKIGPRVLGIAGRGGEL